MKRFMRGIGVFICFWLFYACPVFAAQLMLPFSGGSTWTCDQENNDTPTHKGNLYYAWDFNMGADDLGKPVLAPAAGNIVYAKDSGSDWGKVVIIDYGDGTFGKLAHLQRIDVSENQCVIQGASIGTCGGTGGWSPHIHYQTQNNRYISSPSIQSTFLDAEEADRIPKLHGYYTSLNTHNPVNGFRIGKFADGWKIRNFPPDGYNPNFVPLSRPFAITYFHLGGLDKLGVPINEVHQYPFYPGAVSHCNDPTAVSVWIQDTKSTNGDDKIYTLVLNPYVINFRLNYPVAGGNQYWLGVVFSLEGPMRNYWFDHYCQLGPPISQAYEETVNGKKYKVQWFEPGDDDFIKVTYNTVDQTFNDPQAAYLSFGDHLNQSIYQVIGCPGGDCGTGGGSDPDTPDTTSPSNAGCCNIFLGYTPEGFTWLQNIGNCKRFWNNLADYETAMSYVAAGQNPRDIIWDYNSGYYFLKLEAAPVLNENGLVTIFADNFSDGAIDWGIWQGGNNGCLTDLIFLFNIKAGILN